MTQEEIKSKLQPLLKAIQKAEQEYAEAKSLIKTAIAKPYMNKSCRINKGDTKYSEGRIVNVVIDPNYDVWFLVQVGEDAHYYPIEYLEVFLEK
jgi:hypothetical protein